MKSQTVQVLLEVVRAVGSNEQREAATKQMIRKKLVQL